MQKKNKENITDAEKARLAHNAYNRAWYHANKDKVRESRQKSLARKYDEMIKKGEL